MDINLELLNGLTEIIANVGFPIFIATFLLNRMETKVVHMIDALDKLIQIIAGEK